jgi:surfeit locus 1 family protein
MIRFRRPELIPTLFIGFMVALMFTLGVWQLQRLQWKTELLARIEAAQSAAPKDILSYPADKLPDFEWFNVRMTGRFLHDKELYATPRYYKEQLGYAILTPLAIDTPRGPVRILVNRGWVPPEKKDPGSRSAANINAPVTVEGVIRVFNKKGLFRPDNNPEKNIWFWYDVPAMARAEKLELLPVVIDATRITDSSGASLSGGPIPFPLEINIRNDHLGYAITWFLMGLTGIVMFGVYYRKPE